MISNPNSNPRGMIKGSNFNVSNACIVENSTHVKKKEAKAAKKSEGDCVCNVLRESKMCKDHQNFVEKKGHCYKVAAVCADVIYVDLKSTERRCCAVLHMYICTTPLL